VLVGQPELEAKLKQPQLRQLRQRLTLRAKTHPLTIEETRAYVQQRLRIAGSTGANIFDSEALGAIHRDSKGIPRVVNLICEHCMVSAFVDQKKTVTVDIVDAVARDFELREDPAAAPPTPARDEVKFDVAEALRSLATIAERLRESDRDLAKERKA
jgi:general secretion pathway protein A